MSDSDVDSDTPPIRKRKIKEISIPNGLLNGPVKHKKIKTPDAPKELFPLHSLCAFIGMRGSGKTHAMVNLAKRYLDEGCFTRVFINPIFHVLHIAPKDVYSNLHTFIKDIAGILEKCKEDSDDYDDYHVYMKAYLKWRRHDDITLDERTMLENTNYQNPPKVQRPSPLLIVDDMSHSEIYSTSRQNPFINLCLRHRHINHGKGITIFLAAQTFRSGIPLALRQNIQQYFIWPTKDETHLEAIYHEVANLIDHETFIKLYNPPSPVLQLRRNFDTFFASFLIKHGGISRKSKHK
jgi:hypothetical protein